MPYCVVLEYQNGGSTGVRFIKTFSSKEEFLKQDQPDQPKEEGLLVIAEGISMEEAQKLAALTPEICYLTAAVEEMCSAEDGHIDIDKADLFLQHAAMNIASVRKIRKQYGLQPTYGFPFVLIDGKKSQKNQLFTIIKGAFSDPWGTVGNIENAIMIVKIKIVAFYLNG